MLEAKYAREIVGNAELNAINSPSIRLCRGSIHVEWGLVWSQVRVGSQTVSLGS